MVRRMLAAAVQAAAWLAVTAGPALAHGGGDMDGEMGRPILLSLLLFVTGFCMMVWDPDVFPSHGSRRSSPLTKE